MHGRIQLWQTSGHTAGRRPPGSRKGREGKGAQLARPGTRESNSSFVKPRSSCLLPPLSVGAEAEPGLCVQWALTDLKTSPPPHTHTPWPEGNGWRWSVLWRWLTHQDQRSSFTSPASHSNPAAGLSSPLPLGCQGPWGHLAPPTSAECPAPPLLEAQLCSPGTMQSPLQRRVTWERVSERLSPPGGLVGTAAGGTQ